MVLRTFGILLRIGQLQPVRRHLSLLGGLLALTLLFAGTRASAQSVHFGYVGGRWSHARHAGWHRYWGGPSIGFYFAPTPVYVVPGYAAASYYTGSNFWYSNPSFGLSVNIGGGGGGYYGGRGTHYNNAGHFNHNSGRYNQNASHYNGGRSSGAGHFSGGRSSGGARPSGGGRSAGPGHSGGGGRPSGGARSAGGDRGHR